MLRWIGFAFLLGIAALTWWLWPRYEPFPETAVRRPIIVIVPFSIPEEQDDIRYLADGIALELNRSMARCCAASVNLITPTAVESISGNRKPLAQLGREYDGDYVLSGHIERLDSMVAVSAEIIRLNDEQALWAETVEIGLGDMPDFQIGIIEEVARILAFPFSVQQATAIDSLYTEDSQAYDFYLRSLDECDLEPNSDFSACLSLLRQAVTRDGRFAVARAALALAYIDSGAYAGAEEQARAAIELDPDGVRALTALAELLLQQGDSAGAEKEFIRAIELNESFARAHHRYAQMLGEQERYGEAFTHIRTALALAPESLQVNLTAGRIYQAAGARDRAMEMFEAAVDLDRNYAEGRYLLGRIYLDRRLIPDAVYEFERAVSLDQVNAKYIFALGEAYIRAEKMDDARRQLNELNRLSRTQNVPAEYIETLTERIPGS